MVLEWPHEAFQIRSIAQLEDRKIGSNMAAAVIGYAQSKDRRIGFIFSCSNYRKCLQFTIEIAYTSFIIPERSIMSQLWYLILLERLWYFMLPYRYIFLYLLMLLNHKFVTIISCFSQKLIFHYVNPFTLKHYVDIETLPTFISIHDTNKHITTKYILHSPTINLQWSFLEILLKRRV